MDACSCDYDPPEFWSKSMPRAKKSHKCEECSGPIAVGERYEYVAGKWEGYFNHFRTCQRCVDLRHWMTKNLPCFCWAHGNLRDDAREAVDSAYVRAADEVRGLRFGLGRRLLAIHRHNALAAAH